MARYFCGAALVTRACAPGCHERHVTGGCANDSGARLSPSRLLVGQKLAAPALDGLGELPECPPLGGQIVPHAHRWALVHLAQKEAARLQLLQPPRQDLVSRPLCPLGQLAVPEWALLQNVQDERVPRPAQHIDRELKRTALRVHALLHRPSSLTTPLSQRK